jgi:hypothetical protein
MVKVYIGVDSKGTRNFTMVDKDGYEAGDYLEAMYAVNGINKEWIPLTEARYSKGKASEMWFRHTDEVSISG